MGITDSAPVYLITARDRVVHWLESPVHRRQLEARLALGEGIYPAYARTIEEACPELPRGYLVDVVDMVRRVLVARGPRMIRRARRAA